MSDDSDFERKTQNKFKKVKTKQSLNLSCTLEGPSPAIMKYSRMGSKYKNSPIASVSGRAKLSEKPSQKMFSPPLSSCLDQGNLSRPTTDGLTSPVQLGDRFMSEYPDKSLKPGSVKYASGVGQRARFPDTDTSLGCYSDNSKDRNRLPDIGESSTDRGKNKQTVKEKGRPHASTRGVSSTGRVKGDHTDGGQQMDSSNLDRGVLDGNHSSCSEQRMAEKRIKDVDSKLIKKKKSKPTHIS